MNLSELYRLFVEETGDALLAVRLPERRLAYVNPAFGALTGFAREELEGEPVSVLNPLLEGSGSRDRYLDGEMLAVPGLYNDVALPTRDGQTRFVTVKVRHAQMDGHTVAFAVIADDTERQLLVRDLTAKHQSLESAYVDLERVHTELKVTQEKMLQASKLMALGELAAGMSHELNQPLTGIRGFAQESIDILKSEPKPKKSQIARLASLIVTNADKMAALLSHLREFARKGKEGAGEDAARPEAVDVARAVKNVQTLLQRQLEKHELRFEARGLENAPQVLAQPYPLEQILINLITNSRDALLDRKRTEPQFKGRILLTVEREAGAVILRVTDNGAGVPEKARARIFDPFFSTKDVGKGMGLGLSISFGIAHRFNGELALESTSPSGTTFRLRLPEAPAAEKRKVA